MRSAKWILYSLALWGAMGLIPVQAQELPLAWEFPAAYLPAPESYLVTYLSSLAPTDAQQFRVPNLGRASCDGLAEAAAWSADTVCGRTPDCLSPGLYIFWVQAEANGMTSPMSNVAACEALPDCTYDCTAGALPPELRALLRTPPGGDSPTIDPDAAQRAVEALAHAPTPPAVASVTTPPPTIADIPDEIQRALDKLPRTPV